MYSHIRFTQSAVILITSFLTLTYGSPTFRSSELSLNNTHSTSLAQSVNRTETFYALSNETEALIEALILLRQRQDLEDGGLESVAQIISGVLGGGSGPLTNIFQGSSGFIGNSAVQEEVQFIFNNISPVFDTIFKYGFDGLKQYFGIGVTTTTPQPPPPPPPQPQPQPMAVVSTRKPQLVYHSNRTQASQNIVNIPALPSQQVFAQVEITTSGSEDNDNDNDSATDIINAN